MRDGEMHAMAGLGAMLITAALGVPTLFLATKRITEAPSFDDATVIEASVAYKKPNAPRQPQKPTNAPPPEVKVPGVSRDENKPVDPKPPDDKPTTQPDQPVDPLAKYRRVDEDLASGPAGDSEPGSADGHEFGKGSLTKGDPYLGLLTAGLSRVLVIPQIARAGGGKTKICIKLSADGKITKAKVVSEGNDDLATIAEKAAREFQEERNASNPEEVPTHLLKVLTTDGICFNVLTV